MSGLLGETIAAAERAIAGEGSQVAGYLDRLLADLGELRSAPESERVYLAALLDFIGLHDQSVRVLRDVPGAVSRNIEGMLAVAVGKYELARDILMEALDAAADSPPLRTQIMANLAAVSLRTGFIEEAAAWVERCADPELTATPATDVLIATIRVSIASRRGDLQALRAAAASLEEASKSRLAELGSQHPQALAVVANMASASIIVARAEGSATRLERAIDVLEVAAFRLAAEFGPDHPQAQAALDSLAAARTEQASADATATVTGEDQPEDLQGHRAPVGWEFDTGSGLAAQHGRDVLEKNVRSRAGRGRFRILGPLEIQSADGWTAIGAVKWRSLLACLLLRPGQLVPTDSLINELWGDSPPSTANNLVSIYVHRLKKVIGDTGGKMLVYRAPGYMLRVAPGDVDIEQFESLAADGRTALAVGDAERASVLFGEALRLWRGPLLADVPPSPLIATNADRMAELWLTTTELRVEADIACGRAVQAIPGLRGLVAEHPLRERLWALLMRALEAAGRRAEALDTYAQARQVIADELGVEPGSELQRLYDDLLAAYASTAAPPEGVTPRLSHSGRRPGPPDRNIDALAALVAGAEAESGTVAFPSEAAVAPDVQSGDPPSGEIGGAIAVGTFADPSATAAAQEAEATATARLTASPAQLPAEVADFTGRETHVDQLCGLLLGVDAARSPGAVRVVVVNGAAGLGKTALAVHAAHQVSAEFPDGQLYVDLLGASSQPANPGGVLARFLRDLGIEGDKVPATDDERAALYRTTLSGRRVLILLDNAKDAAQVRPLLPGSSSCAVLVTTRNRTSDLASTRFLDLNVLEDTEALALFARIVGEERAAAEPDATAEILVACAGLPLAIRICAARLAARRSWRIATLAGRLRNEHRRLDELKTGDLAVRASFQVSYDSLRAAKGGIDPARAFRLLSLWQGTQISLTAASALLHCREDDTAGALEALVDVNLLESPAPYLYRLHDLLRVYATERAHAEETADARATAVERLLRWYLGAAEAAADAVSPGRYHVPRILSPTDYPQLQFTSASEAMAWYDEERNNLLAATRQATAVGMHDIAWQLPPTMFPLDRRQGNWAECVAMHRAGLQSARIAGNRAGEAWVLNQLGVALTQLRVGEALERFEQALLIRRELGDTRGQAQTAIALAEGYLNLRGAGHEALRSLLLAVDLLRPAGAGSMLAVALNNLGEVYFGLGDLRAAEECYIEARDICRQIGSHVEGHALYNLGRIYQLLDRPYEAIASFEEALGKHHQSGNVFGEAITLKHLGEMQARTGDVYEARLSLSAALRIFEQIADRDEAEPTAEMLESLPAGD